MVLVLSLGLAACGQANTPSATGNAAEPQQRQAETVKPKTKLYKAQNGEIEVPVEPKRVVSLVFVGELLALGIKPIGTAPGFMKTGLFVKELEGTQSIGDEPSVEKVLELDPELIIVHNFVEKGIVEQLGKIAPTVVMPFNDRGPVERLRMFADLLDRQAEADQFLARYEQKAKEAKQKLSGAIKPGETVAYYEIWGKSFWVMSEANGRGVYNLYKSLGLTPPGKVKQDVVDVGKGKDISLEVVPQYAADHMFVGVYAGDGGDKRAEEIMQGQLWQNLPAAKNNRVYMVDTDLFSPSDVYALYKQLDLQTDILLARTGK
jgi:iron complex transport system substrate-binding protein